MDILEPLEREGIPALPPKRDGNLCLFVRKPVRASESDPQPDIRAGLADIAPLRLEPVEDAEGRRPWNALVDYHRYHGYRQPLGAHVRYFLSGHRAFAVDGSRADPPRSLLAFGYDLPNEGAHYPQGMTGVPRRLRTRVPVDFGLRSRANERRAALEHLEHPGQGDDIVRDRGCYYREMLLAHLDRDLDCVFRLQRKAGADFDAFIESGAM